MKNEIVLYLFGKVLYFGLFFGVLVYIYGLFNVIVSFFAYGAFGSFVFCWFFIVSYNLEVLILMNLSKSIKNDWGVW